MGSGHYLILGGARSGKSALAEKIALTLGHNPAYIATAQIGDDEMQVRVETHKTHRKKQFVTIEEPLALSRTLTTAAKNHDVILVDCLTLWLSNISFDQNTDKNASMDALIKTVRSIDNCPIILVSNEVGQGIVPDNALARVFRDDAGRLHQKLAWQCANVMMVMAGLPMVLKGLNPLASQKLN